MRTLNVKVTVVLVGVMLVAMLMTGCEEQNLADSKKGRLLAIENQQLMELLEKSGAELEKQKSLLAECKEQKKTEIERTSEGFKDIVNFAMEQNKRLLAENEELKTKIEELEKDR